MATNKKWIVTTSGDRSINDLQQLLVDNGFTVDQVHDQIGCITGSASEDIAERLRSIPGVTDISPDNEIDIGPPGESSTW